MLRETIISTATNVMEKYKATDEDDLLGRNVILLQGLLDIIQAATVSMMDDITETVSFTPLQTFLGEVPTEETEEIQAMYDNLPAEMQEVADKLFEAGPDAVDLFLQAIFEVDPELIEEVVAETGHTMADFHAIVGR